MISQKERPIIFSAEMVKAILEGRKTQTRRVIKPQPLRINYYRQNWSWCIDDTSDSSKNIKCPYGQPGDRLWVKENIEKGSLPGDSVGVYSSDKEVVLRKQDGILREDSWEWDIYFKRKKIPSIHMPHWASRITLEITKIRVERLQEISEEDAKAEGNLKIAIVTAWGKPFIQLDTFDAAYKTGFSLIWNYINGRTYPWKNNPWVWVIEFRRIK